MHWFLIVRTPPPLPLLLGGWASYQIFKNGRLGRISISKGLLLGKRGWFFSGVGGCSFYIKNKLKSEIFNKKKFISKNVFLCQTKNLNWGILTKNLVIFKRWDGVIMMNNSNIMGFHWKIWGGGFKQNQWTNSSINGTKIHWNNTGTKIRKCVMKFD